jgi:translation initiation factor IF-3
MIINEQIRVSEVQLTGINGEDLGIMRTADALELARKHKTDLVCISLMSSPPPCKLMKKGAAKQEKTVQQNKQKQQSQNGSGMQGSKVKVKEIRLTANIEQHDLDTKKRQAIKMLEAGKPVQIVILAKGKEGNKAKETLEELLKELAPFGKKETGIQQSGKGVMVKVNPV